MLDILIFSVICILNDFLLSEYTYVINTFFNKLLTKQHNIDMT